MNPIRMSGLVGGLAGVALLPACGSSSNSDAGGLCAAIAEVNGHRYNSSETYGVPIKLGSPLDRPIAVPACGDGEDTTTRGWAIDGIPTNVAVYAPNAYGAQAILVKDGVVLKPAYAQHLKRSR